MFFGTLLIIVGLVVLYFISHLFKAHDRDFAYSIFLVLWLLFSFGLQIYLTSSWPVNVTVKKVGEVKLHAMDADQQLSGSFSGFFLFQTGSVSEDYVYSYWEVFNGGYHHNTLSDRDYWVTVYEDTNPENAKLQSYAKYQSPKDDYPWAFLTIIRPNENYMSGKWYDFHVPPGTVKSSFSTN